MDFSPERIKELAKNESSYEELLNIVNKFNKLNNHNHKFDWNGDIYYWEKTINDSQSDIYYSPSVETVTGFSVEEILSMPGRLLSRLYEEDAIPVKTKMSEFESSKENSLNLTYRIYHKDNSVIWIKEFLLVERDLSLRITNYKSIAIKVNDLKKNEEELKKELNKLKELNSQKDKFISIVSHDLRAPFTSLLGFSEILINEPDLSEDIKQEYLSYIHEASQNQLQMINYLLDWSRLQTGRLTIEPQRLNSFNVISNVVSSLTGNAIRKDIEIIVDAPEKLYISADERLISQCISNLLSNAIKFTPNGKKIHISAGPFKEGFVEIVVKDEGVGISEEDQSKIFKIDKKLSNKGTNGEKGTGLGLTLVKEIIEKHGGEVWFYSELGNGSEFHFTIPSAKNNVLLVEDDKDTIHLYEKIISKNFTNMNLVLAENGYDAISKIHDILPSLLITDHDMPLMNGIQLIEAVRKKSKNLPVIVLSAKLDNQLVEEYEKLQVEKIINKPFDPDFLVDTIIDIMEL